jgi:hypothetical protein
VYAFNTKTGEVLSKTAARHTSAVFLTDIVVNQPGTQESHVVANNLSTYKTKLVTEFLGATPRRPALHTYLRDLVHQVELWFAKSERGIVARRVFTSVCDLRRKVMRYI